MITIEPEAWAVMVSHAEKTYPNECCGAMFGANNGSGKTVQVAVALKNVFEGEQHARYELRNEDLLTADNEARKRGMELIGIFHSHPDADAYFSATDLANSSPWHSFVVLSVKRGKFDHANSFLPDLDRTKADKEELIWPKS